MQQQQQTPRTKSAPTTIKGAWRLAKRVMAESGTGARVPTLKAYACSMIRHIDAGTETAKDPIVLDAARWLEAKRPGGTDVERKARRTKRKEQQGIRLAAKAARKGKGSLKSSSSEGKGKKKGRG